MAIEAVMTLSQYMEVTQSMTPEQRAALRAKLKASVTQETLALCTTLDALRAGKQLS